MVVGQGKLPILVYSMVEENVFYTKVVGNEGVWNLHFWIVLRDGKVYL